MRTTQITVTVNGETFEFDTVEELQVDQHNLDGELAEQAAHYAFFSVLYERARSQRARLAAEIEELEAQLDGDFREPPPNYNDPAAAVVWKKPTDKAIESGIRRHPKMKQLQRMFLIADDHERQLGAMVYALTHRKDCLVALARSRSNQLNAPTPEEAATIRKNLFGK